MRFSVLMSVYKQDKAAFLNAALESIVTQTLLPDEIIIVKDGALNSELDTCLIHYEASFPGLFRIVSLERNMGLGKALSIGLKYCRYDLVARMDADDISYNERFERQIKEFSKNNRISVIGASIQEFKDMPGDLNQLRKLPSNSNKLIEYAKYRNPLNHPTVIFRKSDVLAVGSYKHMPLFEDYYLWIRMLLNDFKITNLEEPLLHFRIGNDMVGRRSGISYIKKEWRFLFSIYKLKFISMQELAISLFSKTPMRILPKKVLAVLYRKFLR